SLLHPPTSFPLSLHDALPICALRVASGCENQLLSKAFVHCPRIVVGRLTRQFSNVPECNVNPPLGSYVHRDRVDDSAVGDPCNVLSRGSVLDCSHNNLDRILTSPDSNYVHGVTDDTARAVRVPTSNPWPHHTV